jgi:predicted enzyme related to lactoylglutathione lyase
MINLRADDLDGLIPALRAKGAEIGEVSKHVTGRFARLHDPKSNPIELWEAVPEEQLLAIEDQS